MSADEDIAPTIAKGCAAVILGGFVVVAVLYFLVRGFMR